jgi:hypothetical protein
MTPSDRRRSASGSRQGGDDFQHLLAWNAALCALLHRSDLVSLELEAVGAGNADDIVVRYASQPSVFTQVRYAVDGSTPLNAAYFTSQKRPGGTSVLQKFLATWTQLRKTEPSPHLVLVTNRQADSTDSTFTALDGRTSLLIPAMEHAPAGTHLGAVREAWAAHLQVSETELIDLLRSLEFRLSRTYAAEEDRAADLMAALGMKSDEASLRLGIDRARRWVLEGVRRLHPDELAQDIAELDLQTAPAADVLIVQTLARDPTPEDAVAVLDWVDLFEGDSPAGRRRTIDPDAYKSTMQPQLAATAEELAASGVQRVLVRGAARLATLFAVGAALPRVRNIELIRRQGRDLWSTDATPQRIEPLVTSTLAVDQGRDIAVALAISVDLTQDVVAFVKAGGLPVADVITVALDQRATDTSIPTAGHAVAVAQSVRDQVRNAVRSHPGTAIHLFLACPAALALDLGHRWNRIADTTVYEDLNGSYQAAFTIEA